MLLDASFRKLFGTKNIRAAKDRLKRVKYLPNTSGDNQFENQDMADEAFDDVLNIISKKNTS